MAIPPRKKQLLSRAEGNTQNSNMVKWGNRNEHPHDIGNVVRTKGIGAENASQQQRVSSDGIEPEHPDSEPVNDEGGSFVKDDCEHGCQQRAEDPGRDYFAQGGHISY